MCGKFQRRCIVQGNWNQLPFTNHNHVSPNDNEAYLNSRTDSRFDYNCSCGHRSGRLGICCGGGIPCSDCRLCRAAGVLFAQKGKIIGCKATSSRTDILVAQQLCNAGESAPLIKHETKTFNINSACCGQYTNAFQQCRETLSWM